MRTACTGACHFDENRGIFGEDRSRLRSGHAAKNLAGLRRASLSILKRETTFKASLKRKTPPLPLDTELPAHCPESTEKLECAGPDGLTAL